jgi:hypothetical protein
MDWPIKEYLKEHFRNQQSYNNCRILACATRPATDHNSIESSEGEGNEGDKGDKSNEGDKGDKGNEDDENLESQ